MKGAALSDLHLGFRAFPATLDGRNAREVDVEAAWEEAVYQVIADQPDLVTVAGDIVHHPRVSEHAKLALLMGLRRIIDDTAAVVILLQGNHDAGKTADVLTPIAVAEILRPFGEDPRVHVVTEPKRFRLELAGEAVSVACFPYVTRGDGAAYRLDPDPEADVNVLVMHAAVRGTADGDSLPYFYGSDAQALDVGREADRWDVIHCGDFHGFTRLHPERLAFYPGSLERTSSNIWQEDAAKGWVLYDTEAGSMEFRSVACRPMHDLDYRDLVSFGLAEVTAEGVNEALEGLVDDFDMGGAIVRLKLEDFPREERTDIDWSLVRELKRTCLHFELDLRFRTREVEELGDRRNRNATSLADDAREFFGDDPMPVQVLAFDYLEIQPEGAVEGDTPPAPRELMEVPA